MDSRPVFSKHTWCTRAMIKTVGTGHHWVLNVALIPKDYVLPNDCLLQGFHHIYPLAQSTAQISHHILLICCLRMNFGRDVIIVLVIHDVLQGAKVVFWGAKLGAMEATTSDWSSTGYSTAKNIWKCAVLLVDRIHELYHCTWPRTHLIRNQCLKKSVWWGHTKVQKLSKKQGYHQSTSIASVWSIFVTLPVEWNEPIHQNWKSRVLAEEDHL